MSETYPEALQVLLNCENATNLKDHIDRTIVSVGKAMEIDTLEYHSGMYARKDFTVGALVASDPEVRRLVSRAGVNIRDFDTNISIASRAIQEEMNKRSPIGEKIAKVLRDTCANRSVR
jgi:hypothetical protein